MGWGIYLFIVDYWREVAKTSGCTSNAALFWSKHFICLQRKREGSLLSSFFFLLCVVVLTSITSIDPQTSYSCIKRTLKNDFNITVFN